MTITTFALRRLLLASSLVLSTSIACVDSELVVEEGENIDIHYDERFQLCAGNVESFDRGIEFVAEQLMLDPTHFEHMTYTWLSREDYEAVSVGRADDAGGWAFGEQAYSTSATLFHEVVHLIGFNKKLNGITFLVEGLATAFENQGFRDTFTLEDERSSRDPRPELSKPGRKLRYAVAGAFVSYLLARFGPELFWELNQDLGYLATIRTFRRRFAAVYGLDLDDVVADYLSDDSCAGELQQAPMPISCQAPEIPWLSDGVWGYARILDCADDDVVGGWGESSDWATVSVTLRVEEAGVYDLRVLSDHRASGLLKRCGACPWIDPKLRADNDYHAVALEPGLYSLIIGAPASDTSPLIASLLRQPEGTVPGRY